MTAQLYRAPELPWSNSKEQKLFSLILGLLLFVMIAIGLTIPSIKLPEIQREKLEKVPPQLAKVIQRKKEAPKPLPIKKEVKKVEKKIEPKPEAKPKVKKELPKPVESPKVVEKPKKIEKPKPKPIAQQERTPERIKAAREKAKKLISNFSDELADMQSLADIQDLGLDSNSLTNAGAETTEVGSVVDQTAVERVSGVNESALTRETGAEILAVADRKTTKVKELPKEALAAKPEPKKADTLARSQMQIRRVFEQSKSRFDRIYRRALRSNPALEGTVTLGVKVSESGEVLSCKVASSDLGDSKVEHKLISTCKMLSFTPSNKTDEFEWPLAFSPQ